MMLRALIMMASKDIIILDEPTNWMSENEEYLFFSYLRSVILPHQVIVVTSSRMSSLLHADNAIICTQGGILLADQNKDDIRRHMIAAISVKDNTSKNVLGNNYDTSSSFR
jgi:ABC-type multidrug transport system ATPase subunit